MLSYVALSRFGSYLKCQYSAVFALSQPPKARPTEQSAYARRQLPPAFSICQSPFTGLILTTWKTATSLVSIVTWLPAPWDAMHSLAIESRKQILKVDIAAEVTGRACASCCAWACGAA